MKFIAIGYHAKGAKEKYAKNAKYFFANLRGFFANFARIKHWMNYA